MRAIFWYVDLFNSVTYYFLDKRPSARYSINYNEAMQNAHMTEKDKNNITQTPIHNLVNKTKHYSPDS